MIIVQFEVRKKQYGYVLMKQRRLTAYTLTYTEDLCLLTHLDTVTGGMHGSTTYTMQYKR